jgi:hypothetical protein
MTGILTVWYTAICCNVRLLARSLVQPSPLVLPPSTQAPAMQAWAAAQTTVHPPQ